MKKTIADLKLNDPLYYLANENSVFISESKVVSLSIDLLIDNERNEFKMNKEDFSRWTFGIVCRYSSRPMQCYLDRNDLLPKILENSKNILEKEKKCFEKFLQSLSDKQKRILEIEFEITNSK